MTVQVEADFREWAARFAEFYVPGSRGEREFRLTIKLVMAARRWTDAMDELLEILMRDKAWGEEVARKTYVAILEIIEQPKAKVADGQIPPDDPVVATYRRRLSSVVLS